MSNSKVGSKFIKKFKDDKQLYADYKKTVAACNIIHKDRWLVPFSDHGVKHSERMIEVLENLDNNLFTKKGSLNIYEAFILIIAIYLHDIGMQLYNDDVLYDFAHINNLMFNKTEKESFVREHHPSLSKYWVLQCINGNKFKLQIPYTGPDYLGEQVAKVVEGHGNVDFLSLADYNDTAFKGFTIRTKLLTALLCLADTLDCDCRRIDFEKLNSSEISNISKLHWYKHYYVNSVNISENTIELFYSFPDLVTNDIENYKLFFQNETEFWINYCIQKYTKLYDLVKLQLRVISHFETSIYKEPINSDMYEILQNEAVKIYLKKDSIANPYKIAIGILKLNGKILMVKRRIPEGNLKWQFPTGQIKPNETGEKRVVEEVKDETNIVTDIIKELGARIFPESGVICYYYALKYVSGDVINGDPTENECAQWVPISEYKDYITSSIFSGAKKYIEGDSDE